MCACGVCLHTGPFVKKETSKTHLSVGILGRGQMGKQLAMVLLQVSSLMPSNMNTSTKRPETLGGISLDQRWVSAVLYTLLHMCMAEKLGSGKALQLLNECILLV
ncbi:NADP-dependent oxidoreductase domain-containing protein 1-like [Myxocyprinus asiaticus]|uniref:NADP-dependent oxidoreductase domain-containing protein 1-like n=1 Tax=Myxocyprinus asiaticus TaxID=70543 RepID=UPI0022217FF4|nr:NADP-dependent oxidoreductase domain-containing protein 1-like [Myxocyprinus asiaticus]